MKNKSKKVKEISLPMKFNPGLSKFEPELPLRKSKTKEVVERKRNWWAFWYIVIEILLFALFVLWGVYLFFNYFIK